MVPLFWIWRHYLEFWIWRYYFEFYFGAIFSNLEFCAIFSNFIFGAIFSNFEFGAIFLICVDTLFAVELQLGLQLLGLVLSIFPVDTSNLDNCLYLVSNFASHPTEAHISLAALSLEALTDLVSARHLNYRTNQNSLRIFSTVMESVFGTVSRLTENQEKIENSYLDWEADGEYVPRLVHFCRTFMANHFNYFRYIFIGAILQILNLTEFYTFWIWSNFAHFEFGAILQILNLGAILQFWIWRNFTNFEFGALLQIWIWRNFINCEFGAIFIKILISRNFKDFEFGAIFIKIFQFSSWISNNGASFNVI